MLDKDEYEAIQKRERQKLTQAKIKKMGITCGNCKHYGKMGEKGERLPVTEKGLDMCFKTYPNVSGPIGLRGARANNSKEMYCGMAGKFFYPKNDEAAGIKDREKEKARLKAEAKAELKAEMAAEAKAKKDAEPAKPGDEMLPIQKKGRKSKPGEG